MNPKLQKTVRELERTRARIAELQTLLPELEKRKTDLENTEIVKAVRSASVAPGDLAAFLRTLRAEPAARRDYTETEEFGDEN
ncbi:MAG: DUF4315 family protein [Oscillospiraceae bacterium]|jgi:hypothetical protein|nr:DUF4315 family protein [Oscillospiraceae bacterium]